MIKKNIINELIRTQDLAILERHLIYSYLTNNKLSYKKSAILSNYLKEFVVLPELYEQTSSLNISTIKELENYLELIIPASDRKFNGAFFTPEFIIDFIINEIKPKISDLNLDPSCGCGAFLVGLTDYYKKTFDKPIRKIVKDNIFGSDILDYNVQRTKLILTIYALQHEEILRDEDFNIFHRDSLRTEWDMAFNNIVGNPPYVKFQDLTDDNREYLANHWTTVEGGTFNLYFAFFELGYKLLKGNGMLGYITPNNYFTSLSGQSLRKYFHEKKCVSRIIDFSHKKVFDAQTYTAITFLTKRENTAITYDRIKEKQTPEIFLESANGSLNQLNELNAKKWRLLKTDEQENIRKIETIGTPIGQLFDICVGIATLKDEIYFVDSKNEADGYYIKETEKGVFKIEKEITKSVCKISDFKTQKEAAANARRIICPYNIENNTATAISEKEFKLKYPNCYTYFLSEKDNLLSRDKGKVKFEPFYVWGRTQGLTRIGKKILTPTFSQHPRFLINLDIDGYFTNGYGIYPRKSENQNSLFNEQNNYLTEAKNIDVVQKILNSCIMQYYITKTSVSIEGGYPCYQKNFIEKFTMPFFTVEEIATLRKLTVKEDIDHFLIAKYQLNVLAGNLTV